MRGRGALAAGTIAALALLAAVFALAGCGSEEKPVKSETPELDTEQYLEAADEVDLDDFPKTNGRRTLTQLMGKVAAARDLALAPGAADLVQGERNRLPFGLFTQDRKPVWSPTVVYLAKDAKSPAVGPFAAPALSLDVPEEFRADNSKADYDDLGNGIYVADIKAIKGVENPQVMTLTNFNGRYHATLQSLGFREESPTPSVGDKAPVIENPTLADVGGEKNAAKICTREPHDSLHETRMRESVRKGRPVVLVFATPKHCVSRVCGPVVDVAEYVSSKYSDVADFIHQEVYNDNDPNKGFVEPVGAYGLPAEPYTFVIDGDGRVAYKFEGPVTIPELEGAVREVTEQK
jgi:hypothetical protein